MMHGEWVNDDGASRERLGVASVRGRAGWYADGSDARAVTESTREERRGGADFFSRLIIDSETSS